MLLSYYIILLFYYFIILLFILYISFKVMQEYLLRRKAPPKEIIFYRDGVGEGMYDLVCIVKQKLISLRLMSIRSKRKRSNNS
jgi:hypothetical protein